MATVELFRQYAEKALQQAVQSRANQNIPPLHGCSTFLQCAIMYAGATAIKTGNCTEKNHRRVRQCAPRKARAAYVRVGSKPEVFTSRAQVSFHQQPTYHSIGSGPRIATTSLMHRNDIATSFEHNVRAE